LRDKGSNGVPEEEKLERMFPCDIRKAKTQQNVGAEKGGACRLAKEEKNQRKHDPGTRKRNKKKKSH